MKSEILRIMRESEKGYVSGSALCEKFGVSRQAIWKCITALKEQGYEFESIPKKGYRLIASPDNLCEAEISSRITANGICRKVEFHDSVNSTNNRAKILAESGAEEGTLIVAEEQTAGKGRRGRGWESEPGVGIWMSLLLRPMLSTDQVSGLTLVTALAIAKAIKKVTKADVKIKWPNDIVLNGHKICGILTEMSSEESYIHYVVVGIGINANTTIFPEEIKNIASSIYRETGKKVQRAVLIAEIMDSFSELYRIFQERKDLSFMTESYNSLLVNRDKEVKIYYGMVEDTSDDEIEQGIAKGIDTTGALMVEIQGEEKRIISGEVSVRGIYHYT